MAGRAATPHLQIQLRWLMASVAVVAVILSLPPPVVEIGGLIGATLAVATLVPAGLAPRGRRVEAASWGFILHPLLLLGWLMACRLVWFRGPLSSSDHSLALSIVFEIPYLLAVLSIGYGPVIFFMLGYNPLMSSYRRWADTPRLVACILTSLATLAILAGDPFDLYNWVID